MSTYNIAVTAMIFKEDKVLLTKRSSLKKKWPNKWTLPGGNLEDSDFLGTPTEINNQWYNTLENCLRREVREEVGLEIENIAYLCNIAVPGCIIVSYTADWVEGDVILQVAECDRYEWVNPYGAHNFDLIDGIGEEIISAADIRFKMPPQVNRKPVGAFK